MSVLFFSISERDPILDRMGSDLKLTTAGISHSPAGSSSFFVRHRMSPPPDRGDLLSDLCNSFFKKVRLEVCVESYMFLQNIPRSQT